MDSYKLFFLTISINDVGKLEQLKFNLKLELEVSGILMLEILNFTLRVSNILRVFDSTGYPSLKIIKKLTSKIICLLYTSDAADDP